MLRSSTLALALVCAATAAVSAPVWTEKAVVVGKFGAAPDQFGRAGIETSKKTQRLVNCFAASTKYIAIHDRVKRDVKVFAHTGAFDRKFPLRLSGTGADTVRARDMVLQGETLHVLVDEGESKTLPARMRIASFDVATGACRDVRSIETARLSARQTARGADAFLLHADDSHLWLVDIIRQLSFEITAAGPTHLGERPAFGWGGTNRVRTDDTASSINLLDNAGKVTRRIPETGALVAVSPDGAAIAALQTSGGTNWAIVVFNSTGDKLSSSPRPNRTWKPFKSPVMERKYELVETPAGAELYEFWVDTAGVHVVRWAR